MAPRPRRKPPPISAFVQGTVQADTTSLRTAALKATREAVYPYMGLGWRACLQCEAEMYSAHGVLQTSLRSYPTQEGMLRYRPMALKTLWLTCEVLCAHNQGRSLVAMATCRPPYEASKKLLALLAASEPLVAVHLQVWRWTPSTAGC